MKIKNTNISIEINIRIKSIISRVAKKNKNPNFTIFGKLIIQPPSYRQIISVDSFKSFLVTSTNPISRTEPVASKLLTRHNLYNHFLERSPNNSIPCSYQPSGKMLFSISVQWVVKYSVGSSCLTAISI